MLIMLSLGNSLLRVAAITFILWTLLAFHAHVRFDLIWVIPPLVAIIDGLDALRVTPETDRKDFLLAVLLLPMEAFTILRESWTICSLVRALRRKSLSW
jgi:hypothetical protein